ncbi:hypothetical protein AB6T38_01570 [Aliiglaciecola sp. SL4]|uniref:hypothetical protein n=1 Tax=Aliiglaciecola sp. SL4 TaxID=3239806 RepID=UPI00355B9BFE
MKWLKSIRQIIAEVKTISAMTGKKGKSGKNGSYPFDLKNNTNGNIKLHIIDRLAEEILPSISNSDSVLVMITGELLFSGCI